MKERLQIKNFGPLKDIDIELKHFMVLIGPQGVGKSVIAKLVSIGHLAWQGGILLMTSLEQQRINWITGETRLLWNKDIKDDWAYNNGVISPEPHYIPAERGFLPSITGLALNLIQNKVPLAPGVLDFGATFEKARLAIPKYENPLLGVTYQYENGTDKLYLKDNTGVNLKDAASGYQTIIPLMLVVEYLTQDKDLGPHYFIIEEPELNLYPSTQTALVQWLVKKCKESNSKLLMTTHSPYILTAMDNLIKAGEVAKQKPEAAKDINKLVKKDYWLDFDNVGVYYINKGKAKSLMNKTNRTINATAIDDVSEEMATTFDKLLDIQYQEK